VPSTNDQAVVDVLIGVTLPVSHAPALE